MDSENAQTSQIDRLLDAIELVQLNRQQEAVVILRQLIGENKDFEDAWLWMSVAVESLDQSIVCLDNVLRINPDNWQAASALYRLREDDMRFEKRRRRLRSSRDTALIVMWFLIIGVLFGVLFTFVPQY